MKIKIIGTGSMWNELNSASFLVDNKIMVDCPNGACKYLSKGKLDVGKIKYLLITHFHGDQYFDVPFLILNKSKFKTGQLTIYCSKDGKSKIKKLGNLAFPHSFDKAAKNVNLEYDHSMVFKIDNYDIEKILVDHGSLKPAYGYIFRHGDNIVGFTGDTSLCNGVEAMAAKCQLLFCDCMFLKGTNKHQGIDNILYLASKFPNCKFIPVHMEMNTKEHLLKKNIKNIRIYNDYDEIKL